MITLFDLWLPILLAAAFVFVVSSIFHMVIPIHRSDFRKLPGEDDIRASIRVQNLLPGLYMYPCADTMKEMNTPEMMEKYREGPVGLLTVLPSGPPNMSMKLVQWFLFCCLIGVFVAYVATLALSPGAAFGAVFRITGTVAILGYAAGSITDSLWRGQPWSVTLKFIFDGIIYGLVTAGTFGWLWPEAA